MSRNNKGCISYCCDNVCISYPQCKSGATGPQGPPGATGATGIQGLIGATGPGLRPISPKYFVKFDTPGDFEFQWPDPSVQVVYVTMIGAGSGGGGAASVVLPEDGTEIHLPLATNIPKTNSNAANTHDNNSLDKIQQKLLLSSSQWVDDMESIGTEQSTVLRDQRSHASNVSKKQLGSKSYQQNQQQQQHRRVVAAAGGGGGSSGSVIVRFPLINDGSNPTLVGNIGAGGSPGAPDQSVYPQAASASEGGGSFSFVRLPNYTALIVATESSGGGGSILRTDFEEMNYIIKGGAGAIPTPAFWINRLYPGGTIAPFTNLYPATGSRPPTQSNGAEIEVTEHGFDGRSASAGIAGAYGPINGVTMKGVPFVPPYTFQSYSRESAGGGGGGAYYSNDPKTEPDPLMIFPASIGALDALPAIGYETMIGNANYGVFADGGGGGLSLHLPQDIANSVGRGGAGGFVDEFGEPHPGEPGQPGLIMFEW